jgi:hypothetical protein
MSALLKISRFLILLLLPLTAMANLGNGCPSVSAIERTSGEFSWISKTPGWSGQYVYPMQGKGHSTHVTQFIEARWIQVNNLENAAGYVECDYRGNYDDEVIRFVQAGTRAQGKPTDIHWTCQLNPHFPGVQCHCSASTQMCVLYAMDNQANAEPMYINPEGHAGMESMPPVDVYMDK